MKVIALLNKSFAGDNNQVQGIIASFKSIHSPTPDIILLDESELNIDALESGTVIVAAGDHGLIAIDGIKARHPEIHALWSGHQVFDTFHSITHWPDVTALPKTAVTEEDSAFIAQHKTRLELTDGVAHNVNQQTINDDLAKFTGILPAGDQYTTHIGIILAGDAPTASGEMRFFGPDDARAQAKTIANHIQSHALWHEKTAIMVTNGPRTGKHDITTKEICSPDPHRSNMVDASSHAFLDELAQQLSTAPGQICFYDFQFATLPSAYKPMMHVLAQSPQAAWFVPCESTSMVSESTWLVEQGVNVIVYHPGSENEAHLRHTEDYVRQGIVADINNPIAAKDQKRDKPVLSASRQIAARLLPSTTAQAYCSFFIAPPSSSTSTADSSTIHPVEFKQQSPGR